MAEVPSRDLVDRLRSGEGAAFDELYAAERDRVYRFLFRLCGGRRDLAEDLFQETWMRLARHARTLRADTDLVAWLYTVGRNLHRSHARWAVVDRRALGRLERWWYLDDAPSQRPDERAAAAAALSRLEAAIAELPGAQREVLLLAVGEGLPQDEVARLLGMSHDAVRQRLSRARAALARQVETEDPTCNAIVPVNR